MLGNVSHAREHAELLFMRNTMSNDVPSRIEEEPGVVIVENLTHIGVNDKGDQRNGKDGSDEQADPLYRDVLGIAL